MKLLVCGSRSWTDKERMYAVLSVLPKPDLLIHGDARGADKMAAEIGLGLGWTVDAHPADWYRHGKAAGPIRNKAMLDLKPDLVLAFRAEGASPGTDHMIQSSIDAGVEVRVYEDASLNEWQEMVRDFHEQMRPEQQRYTGPPALRLTELRMGLIAEEYQETVAAVGRGDLVEAIDGLCDMMYVILGAAEDWGVNLDPVFYEVHRTNMLKVGGGRREDGKCTKPEGWQPPDIAGELKRQGWTEAP